MTRTLYKCLSCRNRLTIMRSGNRRKVGHIKSMWCVRCKGVRQHAQLSR